MNHKLILKSLKLLALVLACFALAAVPQTRPEDRASITVVPESPGFLGQLEQVWAEDSRLAVLLARWYWERLPERKLVEEAAVVQAQLRQIEIEKQIRDYTSTWLGSGGGVLQFDSNHATFITTMNTIRIYRGDPPASPESAKLAEAVLLLQVDPLNALVAVTPGLNRQQAAMLIQQAQMTGMDQMLRIAGLIDAACALPRERIPVLIRELQR